jgi:hypothetical protein
VREGDSIKGDRHGETWASAATKAAIGSLHRRIKSPVVGSFGKLSPRTISPLRVGGRTAEICWRTGEVRVGEQLVCTSYARLRFLREVCSAVSCRFEQLPEEAKPSGESPCGRSD